MTDFIELAKAIAWPLAIFFASLFAFLTTWLLVSRKQGSQLRIPKILDLTSNTPPLAPAAPPASAASEGAEMSPTSIKNLEAEDIDRSGIAIPAHAELAQDPAHESFFTTKDQVKLKTLFEEFIQTVDNQENREFWQAYYVNRQVELGFVEEQKGFTELVSGQPSNVWAYIYLARRCKRLLQLKDAADILQKALEKAHDDNRPSVLAEAVYLYWDLDGPDAAYGFVRERVISSVTDREGHAVEGGARICRNYHVPGADRVRQ